MKLKLSTFPAVAVLAGAVLLGTAQGAAATPLLFDFTGEFSADFVLDSSPTPDVVGSDFFEIATLNGDYQGAPVTFEDVHFQDYTGGGFIAFVYVGGNFEAAPSAGQGGLLYAGSPADPVFAPGSFNLLGQADFASSPVGNETLTISPVSGVPEPGVWAMMLMGLAAVGGWLRAARRRRAVQAAAPVA
jgi:hypothetical protein